MNDSPRPLAGHIVLLSASVPSSERDELYRQQLDVPYRVRDAVVAVAHAILKNGGRLVFGGHPTISPLVLLVAGELFPPAPERASDSRPIIVYQSRTFERIATPQTRLMEELGYARIRWTPGAPGEDEATALRQNSKSLLNMRQAMILEERIRSGVFIGGMEGIFAEYNMLRNSDIRIRGASSSIAPATFLLPTTGGATAVLAQEIRGRTQTPFVDEIVQSNLAAASDEIATSDASFLGEYVSYPLVADEIVRRIAEIRDI